jgi:hypothetical protein
MKYLILVATLALAACGGHSGTTIDGNGGGDDGGNGDSGPGFDAAIPPGCTTPDLTKPQCSNCIDDDNDGYIDSFDIQCTGPLDNDEATFQTGIPGDNVDPVHQDCFFDGNSGAGNDGCNIHVCCLLGATTVAQCPIGANSYNPMDCPPPLGTHPLSQMCIDYCGALTPPGCDCFGCCTLCNPNNPTECYDIITNPNVSPNCTLDTLADPATCVRCNQVGSCGSDCGGTTCILCPGQDPSDLPPSCNGMTSCPAGQASCANGATCAAGTYCDQSSQCCVGVIQ